LIRYSFSLSLFIVKHWAVPPLGQTFSLKGEASPCPPQMDIGKFSPFHRLIASGFPFSGQPAPGTGRRKILKLPPAANERKPRFFLSAPRTALIKFFQPA